MTFSSKDNESLQALVKAINKKKSQLIATHGPEVKKKWEQKRVRHIA